jgi:hypothetical protein
MFFCLFPEFKRRWCGAPASFSQGLYKALVYALVWAWMLFSWNYLVRLCHIEFLGRRKWILGGCFCFLLPRQNQARMAYHTHMVRSSHGLRHSHFYDFVLYNLNTIEQLCQMHPWTSPSHRLDSCQTLTERVACLCPATVDWYDGLYAIMVRRHEGSFCRDLKSRRCYRGTSFHSFRFHFHSPVASLLGGFLVIHIPR